MFVDFFRFVFLSDTWLNSRGGNYPQSMLYLYESFEIIEASNNHTVSNQICCNFLKNVFFIYFICFVFTVVSDTAFSLIGKSKEKNTGRVYRDNCKWNVFVSLEFSLFNLFFVACKYTFSKSALTALSATIPRVHCLSTKFYLLVYCVCLGTVLTPRIEYARVASTPHCPFISDFKIFVVSNNILLIDWILFFYSHTFSTLFQNSNGIFWKNLYFFCKFLKNCLFFF